jgi:hypothetical protein
LLPFSIVFSAPDFSPILEPPYRALDRL